VAADRNKGAPPKGLRAIGTDADEASLVYKSPMASDLSHLPDIQLDTRSGQLAEAYIKTWRRVVNRPATLTEFLRHLHVRTVLGLDAPFDRLAMAIVNLTILEQLRDFASRNPEAQKQGDLLAERRELFLQIARGDAVTVGLDENSTWGSLEIESGHVRVALSRPLGLDHAAWKVQVGPQVKAVAPSKLYQEIATVSSIRIVDAVQGLMGGRITWREFAAEWRAVWHRQMARVLLEPLVPASLRQFTASAAQVSLMMLQNIGKDFDDHTADDILPSRECQQIWEAAMGQISDGGLLLAVLASNEGTTVALHFEGLERYGGSDEAVAVSVHPDLPETFCRVSEATLLSGDASRAAVKGKDPDVTVPLPTQRTKVGRNELCPCGSGRKYKKCCWPRH